MSEQGNKGVKIVETVLRDAHQSLIATRMTTGIRLVTTLLSAGEELHLMPAFVS